ncbi:MAG: cytidylyltransferase domain-containing protein [Hyphomicrobium sp.]
MSRTVAIIQARLASTRLPGKVLYEIGGQPLISFMVQRVARTRGIDEVALAVSEDLGNEALAEIAGGLGIAVFRGSEKDLLSRYCGAAQALNAGVIVRLTGDCPLADPEVIELVVERRRAEDLDYCTNVHPPTWPDGLDVSTFTRATLERACAEARRPTEREHVVPWMWRNSPLEGGSLLTAGNVSCPEQAEDQRWTVDGAADYLMLRALVGVMGAEGLARASWRSILAVMRARPDIRNINAAGVRDAGLVESRARESAAQ